RTSPYCHNKVSKSGQTSRILVYEYDWALPAASESMQMPNHCPSCQSTNISRSKRRGLFESIVFKLIHVRPYRCLSCDSRFFRRAFIHRHTVPPLDTTDVRSNIRGVLSVLTGRESSDAPGLVV